MLTAALLALAFSPSKASAMDDKSIKEAYEKSYNYGNLGNYGDAIKSLALVHKEYPETYTVNMRLGYLYFLNTNYANASNHYLSAQKAAPKSLPPLLGAMRITNIKEQYEKTEESGYKVLQSDLYNYYGNLYLAYALRKSKKYEAASAIDLKMLEVYPSDAGFLLEYGLLTFAQGNKDAATSALHYLLILDPENVVAKEVLILLNQQGSLRK